MPVHLSYALAANCTMRAKSVLFLAVSGLHSESSVVISPVLIHMASLLCVVTGDKAASFHKPHSKSQLHDSGYTHSGSESLLKVIKVGCLDALQLILVLIIMQS